MNETVIEWLEYIHKEFGFIPDYIWSKAYHLEKMQLQNAFNEGKQNTKE